ncbi:MAG: ADP-forming succinate--CoA ligase subunit beta [Candidatus Eisenbacteria bacterium]|uniref:Succinate--CoA ligase [ADP-forming] subunit beta n=1 Tax=Eiseniibacteriota bacterium TaxID=2212470 RepID=A0A956SE99_UNCEI|nr:ADP-forming succinate--CoA ligase subunit beta [Candidatus Eisenbacteria bacterium]MCB9462322.1 ADP-forming succinate--CoA ligase subunit beta [Candidatus Eisenbacteria bacterium]
MNIHEYQAKQVFLKHGIPVPPGGEVAGTAAEAEAIAAKIGGPVVVKAQVHSGGRGKAGGVKLAKTAAEAKEKAEAILQLHIQGLPVRKVLVAPALDIAHEYYLGIVLDRQMGLPAIMISREGGVEIEEVARTKPEALHKLHFDPARGLRPYEARQLAAKAEPDGKVAGKIARVIEKLAKTYASVDASLAEINPLIQTPDGDILALDAKINLDDNALYRHPDLEAMRDPDTETDSERVARDMGLTFIKLDGSIGCVVNGAGLAMATMDLVKHFGGDPANFLDIGGSSNPDKVVTAIRIITEDPNVKAILFNIFGGITRCDDVARGLVEGVKQTGVKLPIVIRLVGTNEKEGREILASASGLHPAETMDDAVKKVVELAGAGA